MISNAQNENTYEFPDKPRNVGTVSKCFTLVKMCTPVQ